MELVKRNFKQEDISLKEVNGAFVRNFEFYLKTEKGCAQNTVIRYMKCFKKVINLAIANEWINKNPFAGIKFQEVEVNKEFLTQAELNKIMNKDFGIERLELVRDIFIFCCFCGLAFCDVKSLNEREIITDSDGNKWIYKSRKKTDNQFTVPLMDIPLAILEKYKDDPQCKKKGVLLPVNCNQTMNKYLKPIGDICGINKKITTHVARHTFATTITLANRVPLKTVQQC